jgi:hypothetical protein
MISFKLKIFLCFKNCKRYWILKINSYNGIGLEGAAKLSIGISRLLNLTSLNLNF